MTVEIPLTNLPLTDFQIHQLTFGVTREISIHDGAIESDKVSVPGGEAENSAELRENTQTDTGAVTGEAVLSIHKQKDSGLGWYIAGLMFRARPAWTFFMTLFFALMTFAVFAFLGTVIANLDDTHTAQARKLLHALAAKRQIIYLNCHSSRNM